MSDHWFLDWSARPSSLHTPASSNREGGGGIPRDSGRKTRDNPPVSHLSASYLPLAGHRSPPRLNLYRSRFEWREDPVYFYQLFPRSIIPFPIPSIPFSLKGANPSPRISRSRLKRDPAQSRAKGEALQRRSISRINYSTNQEISFRLVKVNESSYIRFLPRVLGLERMALARACYTVYLGYANSFNSFR